MEAGTVAITFDDGPHPDGTPAVLDRLDELGWSATFFVLGSAVLQEPDVVREVMRRGHAIGVHGFDHRYLISRQPAAAWRDLTRATETVRAVTGTAVRWWRPPYGVLSGPALAGALRLGLRPLLWSAWGKDWTADATPERVAATVGDGRLDGGVVLLHDSDATSAPGSWRTTAAALELIADVVAAARLRVLPLPPR
jgi:peptidoglycan/xylan/chitin deacetylase (PgdA/CDA1 family)